MPVQMFFYLFRIKILSTSVEPVHICRVLKQFLNFILILLALSPLNDTTKASPISNRKHSITATLTIILYEPQGSNTHHYSL